MSSYYDRGVAQGTMLTPVNECGAGIRTYNTMFSVVGDSRCAGGYSATASARYLRTNSFYGFAFANIDGRATLDPYSIYATGGKSSDDILNEPGTAPYNAAPYSGATLWAQALANEADNIILLIGVNGGLTAAVNIANITTMLDQAGAAGKRVFLLNELPNEQDTAAQSIEHCYLHEWLGDPNGALLNREWVVPVDSWGAVAGTTKNSFIQYDSLDLLHPKPIGYAKVGRVLATAIKSVIPLGDHFKLYGEDPTGVLTTSSTLTGTGGSTTTDVTGSIADNWVAVGQSTTGLSLVCSKETDADGNVWQVGTISGTPTLTSATKYFNLTYNIDENEWPVGTEAMAGALIDWYDCQNVIGVTLDLQASGDSTLKARAIDGYNATENRPIPASSGGPTYQIIPPIARAADATPSSSNIALGVQIQVSTQPRTIDDAYGVGGYVTIRTTAAHGFMAGQKVTITGLTAAYNATDAIIVSVPLTATINTAVRASNIVTAGTTYPHSLYPGQTVTITGLTSSFNATGVRVLTTPTPTSFTYTAAGADGTAGDQSGTVTTAGTQGTQLTYKAAVNDTSTDGLAADSAGTVSPVVTGTFRFSQPTVRLV